MTILTSTVIIFIVAVVVIELLLYAYRTLKHPDRAKIQKKLRKIAAERRDDQSPELTRRRVLSDVPFLNRILLRITMIDRLDRLRYLANAKYPTGFFILLSLLCFAAGFAGVGV